VVKIKGPDFTKAGLKDKSNEVGGRRRITFFCLAYLVGLNAEVLIKAR
jgi:hypothetical protein